MSLNLILGTDGCEGCVGAGGVGAGSGIGLSAGFEFEVASLEDGSESRPVTSPITTRKTVIRIAKIAYDSSFVLFDGW
jgi:hypothetical protein